MAADTNMLYEDTECAYIGGDPRLADDAAGSVELYADRIRFIDKDSDVLVWPLGSIRHVSFQPGRRYSSEEIMEARLEAKRESEARGREMVWFRKDDIPPGVLLLVNDPEGVMPDGLPVHLGCRDDYRAKVLVKRIRQAARLAPSEDELPLSDILAHGEGPRVEFKERLNQKCAMTVAAFANGYGGTLVVGVTDDNSCVGLAGDNYTSADEFSLRVHNLLREKLSGSVRNLVNVSFIGEPVLCRIDVLPSSEPIYFRDSGADDLYVRRGPSTERLTGRNLVDFIRNRFGGA